MKQGVVFVLASAVLLAGVTTAHIVAPLPDGAPLRSSAKAATTSDAAPQALKPVVETSGVRPLVEARQAPVPLQMRERPPVNLPQTVESAAVATPALAAATDAEGGSFARSAIEADGYRAVKNIVPGADGTWRARALRGKVEVVLTVDREGRVSTE